MAWKGQCLSGTEKRKFKATLVPTLNFGVGGGWQHEGTRVAWVHVPAPRLQLADPAPAPQLQLAAPPAPQLKLTSAVMLPPPAPAAAPVLWATPSVAHWNARWCASAAAVLDLRLPPLLPCMPRLSYLAAPAPALAVPSRASELLTAAAAHRTFVELCLGGQQQLMEEQMEEGDQQQQPPLADLMEEQMTGKDAVDIAISLGMPH